MKYVLALIFLITVCGEIYPKAISQAYYNRGSLADSVLPAEILALPLDKYIGKPVDSLLLKLPASQNIKRILEGGLAYHAERLMVNYGDKYIVYIIVRKFLHMNRFDINRQWNIPQFRQELISWIVVYDTETCIYGCNTSHSWD